MEPPIETIHLVTEDTACLLDSIAPGVFDHDVQPELPRPFLANPMNHLVVAVEGGTVVRMASGISYLHPPTSRHSSPSTRLASPTMTGAARSAARWCDVCWSTGGASAAPRPGRAPRSTTPQREPCASRRAAKRATASSCTRTLSTERQRPTSSDDLRTLPEVRHRHQARPRSDPTCAISST